MEFELNNKELRALSQEILALLEMQREPFGAGAEPNGAAKGSMSFRDILPEKMLPQEPGAYDFLSLRREPGMQLQFLQGGETEYRSLPESAAFRSAWSAPTVSGTGSVQRMRDMEAASDYFRKDSRRYDAVLEKY